MVAVEHISLDYFMKIYKNTEYQDNKEIIVRYISIDMYHLTLVITYKI